MGNDIEPQTLVWMLKRKNDKLRDVPDADILKVLPKRFYKQYKGERAGIVSDVGNMEGIGGLLEGFVA